MFVLSHWNWFNWTFFYYCAKCVPLWRHVECELSFLLERRVNLDVKRVLFGILDLEGFHSKEIHVINLCILVAKMCISKYKYGKPYSMTLMFDTEMKLRLKYLPYIYRDSFINIISWDAIFFYLSLNSDYYHFYYYHLLSVLFLMSIFVSAPFLSFISTKETQLKGKWEESCPQHCYCVWYTMWILQTTVCLWYRSVLLVSAR